MSGPTAFLMRGNLVQVAVASVRGVAFAAVGRSLPAVNGSPARWHRFWLRLVG